MDFITWWFDHHYIVSTIMTPGLSLAWCVYKGLVVRALFAFCLAAPGLVAVVTAIPLAIAKHTLK